MDCWLAIYLVNQKCAQEFHLSVTFWLITYRPNWKTELIFVVNLSHPAVPFFPTGSEHDMYLNHIFLKQDCLNIQATATRGGFRDTECCKFIYWLYQKKMSWKWAIAVYFDLFILEICTMKDVNLNWSAEHVNNQQFGVKIKKFSDQEIA